MDWDKLEQRQIEPPVVPSVPKSVKSLVFPDVKVLLKYYGKEQWLKEVPKAEYQILFKSWYA